MAAVDAGLGIDLGARVEQHSSDLLDRRLRLDEVGGAFGEAGELA